MGRHRDRNGHVDSSGISPDVYFFPWWKLNPYHRELSRAITRLGVRVSDPIGLREIVRDGKGEVAILHLHGIPRVSLGPLRIARLVMFMFLLLRLRMHGWPIVWTIHDATRPESDFPRLERFLARVVYRLSDARIVHSANAIGTIEREWRIRTALPVDVVLHPSYIGVYKDCVSRVEARKQLGIPEGDFVYLFFGRIVPYKGVPRLLNAFKSLASHQCSLIIAGKPSRGPLLDSIVVAAGGEPKIHLFLRRIEDDEVQTFMNASDVLVLPYRHGLTSGALMLGLTFGKVCIAPNIGSIGETLEQFEGYAFQFDDDASLRSAMATALGDKRTTSDRGRRNLQRVASLTWERAAVETTKIYERVQPERSPDSNGRPEG